MDKTLLQDPKIELATFISMEIIGTLHNSLVVFTTKKHDLFG